MDKKQAEHLGSRIQKIRKEKNLSQEELAKKADIPYTTLTKIEIGVIKNPSVFAMGKVAKALDTNLDDLIK